MHANTILLLFIAIAFRLFLPLTFWECNFDCLLIRLNTSFYVFLLFLF